MRQTTAMTLQQVMTAAPSAFAQQAHASRSGRYQFVSTEQVIIEMSKNGFEVFHASQSKSRVFGMENFTKHMLRFRSTSASLINVNDLAPEVVLINSHGGQ